MSDVVFVTDLRHGSFKFQVTIIYKLVTSCKIYQDFMISFTARVFFSWFDYLSIFVSLVSPMSNRKSCPQIDEQQKIHCGDNSKDTCFP